MSSDEKSKEAIAKFVANIKEGNYAEANRNFEVAVEHRTINHVAEIIKKSDK